MKTSGDQKKAEYPLFYGLPEIWKQYSSPMVVPLYEFQDENGNYFYSVDTEMEGMKRSGEPVCRVWRNPSSVLTLDYKAKPVQ